MPAHVLDVQLCDERIVLFMKIGVKILSLAAVLSLGCVFLPQSIVCAQDTVISDWKKDKGESSEMVPIEYTVKRTDEGKIVVEFGEKTSEYRIGLMSTGHPKVLQECSYVQSFVYNICNHYHANVVVFDNIVYEYDESSETFIVTGREGTKYGTVYGFCVNALAPGNSEMLEKVTAVEDGMLVDQALERNPKSEGEYREDYRRARTNLDDVNARWEARQEAIKALEKTGQRLFKNIKKVIVRGNVYKIGRDAFDGDEFCGRGCPGYDVESVDLSESKVWVTCGYHPFGSSYSGPNITFPSGGIKMLTPPDGRDDYGVISRGYPSSSADYYARVFANQCCGCPIM